MAKTATLPRAIVGLDDYTESINLLIYGDTGTGKTILAGQLPGRVLILSSEGGTIVIKRYLQSLGNDDAKRFKVWPVLKWNDLEEAYAWLRDNPDAFDWVVIDSLTSIQHRALRAALEQAVARNPEKRDIDLPDRGEHQKHQNATKRMVQDFNELPVNILWLAQSMYREDRDGNEIVLPFVMGKDYEVSSWVCANVHAFGCYLKQPSKKHQGQTRRVLLFDSFADEGGINHWAKDRYQVLPKSVVMSDGPDQRKSLADLIALIEADPAAQVRAEKRVQERDDKAEVPAPRAADDGPNYESEPEPPTPEPTQDPEEKSRGVDLRPEEPEEPEEPATAVPTEPEALLPDDEAASALEGGYDRETRLAELSGYDKGDLRNTVANAGIDIATLKGVSKAGVFDAILDAEEALFNAGLGGPAITEDSTTPTTDNPKRFRAADLED